MPTCCIIPIIIYKPHLTESTKLLLQILLRMCEAFHSLKMLGLYLYTLIIGHKSCNMLSILNKLILLKELQTFVINNVFLDQKVKTQQQQNKKSNIKTLAGAGDWTRDLLHPKRMRFHCTTESTESSTQWGRNVKKNKAKCAVQTFSTNTFFWNIFTCMNNYIWQFLIFTGVGSAA